MSEREVSMRMWIAPLLRTEWENVKTRVQILELQTIKVDEDNRIIHALITSTQLNALAHERGLCCGHEPSQR